MKGTSNRIDSLKLPHFSLCGSWSIIIFSWPAFERQRFLSQFVKSITNDDRIKQSFDAWTSMSNRFVMFVSIQFGSLPMNRKLKTSLFVIHLLMFQFKVFVTITILNFHEKGRNVGEPQLVLCVTFLGQKKSVIIVTCVQWRGKNLIIYSFELIREKQEWEHSILKQATCHVECQMKSFILR